MAHAHWVTRAALTLACTLPTIWGNECNHQRNKKVLWGKNNQGERAACILTRNRCDSVYAKQRAKDCKIWDMQHQVFSDYRELKKAI